MSERGSETYIVDTEEDRGIVLSLLFILLTPPPALEFRGARSLSLPMSTASLPGVGMGLGAGGGICAPQTVHHLDTLSAVCLVVDQ